MRNAKLPSVAFEIQAVLSDVLNIQNQAGIYGVNPGAANLPVDLYGMVTIYRNSEWIFVEFIPTQHTAIYYNFYEGYGLKEWLGWKKVLTQTI